MKTALKITAFAAAVAATFGTAYGVGSTVTPVTAGKQHGEPTGHGDHGRQDDHGNHGGHGGMAGKEAAVPGGLQISERGYTLALKTPRIAAAGERTELSFAITKDDTGRKVTAYRTEHGKQLHLIVASRDLTVYRHLHPVRAADGTWTTPVELPKAGDYRVFADFAPQSEKEGLTLGADLSVAGKYAPQDLPAPSATAGAGDGYEVRLSGKPTAGAASQLTLSVSRNGKPVTDLQPYLGSYGHLVALRSGDLAYLHVHPNEGGPGPEVSFTATAPSTGTYRLFLDFKHNGTVRTAEFTVQAGRSGSDHSEGHGH
ncbi:hypothetical protein EOT10_25795 [Streptomyces antnestii]|uniref:DUF748 domain-containing protein n=1 Tax=Streptomyces antnestii TaxID=2494256 RepID=A0A3S3UDD6_9ACTN|nr:hypothetical protein [Streptomyces sp. San01]RVU21433.1 hypothetical protein EOT10_25795 [Streptomyces sp. San01]